MEPVLYIDVLFLVNGLCSSFTLWIAGKMFSADAKWWRVLLGGMVSSLLWCVCLVLGIGKRGGIFLSVGLMVIGIYITYCPKSIRYFLGLFVAVWIASFLWGGFFALLDGQKMVSYFADGQYVTRNKFTTSQMLLWGSVLFYGIFRFGHRYLERFGTKKALYCHVEIQRQGKSCQLEGFFDTGNGLQTKSGKPVIVAEFSDCMRLFSKECALQLLKKEIPEKDFEIISFSALGTNKGEIPVFLADKVILTYTQKKQVVKYHVAVGLYFDAFAGNYTALIPPIFIEEEKQ